MSKRTSGVLMHISSLPSPFGIGVFGKETLEFIDTIKSMNFSMWQVLPFHPVNMQSSPYESESAFAGNYLFIDPRGLKADGLINQDDVDSCNYSGSPYTADFKFAGDSRLTVLKKAFAAIDSKTQAEVDKFVSSHKWVKDYALYKAIKTENNNQPWWKWDKKFVDYQSALSFTDNFNTRFWEFVEYEFFKQWKTVKEYASEQGIKILGDMPIYVSMDSCDVWSNIKSFRINKDTYKAEEVAGVPPDYFSADGQLWGNPLYDWDEMENDGFSWWKERIKQELSIYDSLRIDHFRGLASYWAVDSKEKTAKNGVWKDGPGMKLFDSVKEIISGHDIIAEDLGLYGEDVVKLLEDTGFPGIRVIQFGFDANGDSTHLPHNYPKNCVACVGTHDNNTLLGWLWESSPADKQFALRYCGFSGDNWGDGGYKAPACRKIMETLWRSSADTAIIALQDMCGFGSDARMNTPGVADGNWLFRATDETFRNLDKEYFKEINRLYRRG